MIRDAATQRQVDAADPGYSTWLSANAGSGKTRVLTDRVARLLLNDVSPQNILCLTYTKAAATEMQNRLFKRLGAWAMMPDDALRAELDKLGDAGPKRVDRLRHARTLFAGAIETPGGLKIQTIHSFCSAILRRFPLEAGVSPQFAEMEDRAAELLRAEVVDAMLEGSQAGLVTDLLAHFTGDDLSKLTAEVAKNKDLLQRPAQRDDLCRTLGLDPALTEEKLLAETLTADDMDNIRRLRSILANGSSSEVKAGLALNGLSTGGGPQMSDLAILEGVFLTGASAKAAFAAKIGTFPTKATRQAHADLMAQIEPVMEQVELARPNRLGLLALARTLALYQFAAGFIPAYETRKLALGQLDFDDLIGKAKALLTDRDVAQWVLFRLDGGIDHVLVDEAQDTSPTQWAVVQRLTQEFAAGEGANPNRERTVFVVGDKKQSIYSFQGADPRAFDQMRDYFETAHRAVQKSFEVTSLDHSFRSSQAILSVVDDTFTRDRADGMGEHLSHIAFKSDMPGRVDLWPVVEKPDKPDVRVWYDPVDEPSETDHTVLMARQVAEQIKRMKSDETLPVEQDDGTYARRPITEGDILILVQRRSELFAEIIRACKAADLQIAGADRLRVGAELAVKDLAALLSFLALPEDDLSLAAALRSPLFGWSEQQLFTLAHHRPKQGYLWPALRDSDHQETIQILQGLRKEADFMRPYDLIERVLTRHDGRRKLLARLGPEAEDGIDALLSQALAYESTAVPSLTGFLTWMETDDLEVKRQMDSQGDRIRVMTVHGAKGLEAPIVILPDTAKRDIRIKDELLPAGDHLIWKPPAAQSAPAVLAAREAVIAAQARERMRLLYVAMTRAEKWLIIGAAGDVGQGDDSWYNIVADGMRQRGDYEDQAGDLTIQRVSHLDWNVGALLMPDIPAPKLATAPHFDDLPQATPQRTLSPSELPGAKAMPGDPGHDDLDWAKARGTAIHRLLEHFPILPAGERAAVAQRLVDPDHHNVIDSVLHLLDAPHLIPIWADHALTEVDITADIPGLGRIHGAIDRLLIDDGTVLAIDYKSNALVPQSAQDCPLGVQRQLAAYHAGLRQIYPNHRIEMAILWTQTADLMVLPELLLHEALKGVTIA